MRFWDINPTQDEIFFKAAHFSVIYLVMCQTLMPLECMKIFCNLKFYTKNTVGMPKEYLLFKECFFLN